ncbi:helix-turn-helix domain-containing protein [Kitasatospora sp. HPMI-4]|uniref:helix-turn-helix domain-containing protein n=1 Tax=Kitasatospora sp. HPMI-4 TaxID=3448443 RepID=UPI003F1C79BA
MNRRELDPKSSPRAAFGAQLRSSREARDWTQGELGERMGGYSDSYISAVETGRKSTSRDFARAADKAFGTGQTLELMWIGLRRKGFIEGFPEHAAQEARAAEIRIFEPNMVPGLLQTRAYATALEAAAVQRGSTTPDQAEERVKFLATRQRLLKRPTPPLIHAVMDESVIRRPVGGLETMHAQLDHLAELAGRPHVLLQVAPYALAEHAPFRSVITLLTFADRSVVGYTESAEQGYVVRKDETVRDWERAYDRLQVEALTRAASLDLIRKARKELQQ